MRPAALCLLLIASLSAQHEQLSPKIRSITVGVVSTSPKGLTPIKFNAISEAWKRNKVNLVVENRLDIRWVDKAKEVIRGMYSREGHNVRVEYSINEIPPKSVEIAFHVIELCQ